MATRPNKNPKETAIQDGRDDAFSWDDQTAPWVVSDNNVGQSQDGSESARSPRVKWMVGQVVEGVFMNRSNREYSVESPYEYVLLT
jgi:hypothetical protein